MTGPRDPRPGRHASPDSGAAAGRSAAELLAAWASTGSGAVGVAEPRTGARTGAPLSGTPRAGGRRYAGEAAVDAGSDDRPPASPRPPAAAAVWPRVPARRSAAAISRTTDLPDRAPTPGAPPVVPAAPRTAAMPALSPRVPSARPAPEQTPGRPGDDRRFADAATAPGISSGDRRPRLGGRRPAGSEADVDLADADLLTDHRLDTVLSAEAAAGARGGDRAAGATARHHLPHEESEDVPGHRDDVSGHEFPGHDLPGDEVLGYEAPTYQAPVYQAPGHDGSGDDGFDRDGYEHERDPLFEETGGLEVVMADDAAHHDDHFDDHFDDHADTHDDHGGGGPGSGRGGRGGNGRGRRAGRRRRPLAAVLSLLVLAAVVIGAVVGGQALLRTINPVAEDYPGSGSGTVDVRISEGDSLRTIAGTLVGADVIASGGPFLDAAKTRPAAAGIQPGTYRMKRQMSGSAALDLLLAPATRQLSRVTVPEGKTVTQTLQLVADSTGIPLPHLQAAAMDTAGLGLPPYANGMLEGFLFPATYDIEPDTAAADVLRPMVARAVQALDTLGVPVDQRLSVITEASIVQAESGSVEDMGKVARVLDNRLADGMPLQLDTTVNYANGKGGVTTTAQDRANPSPYNTYLHPGLPPGAISNPGEQAIEAVLSPTPGAWRFFVVVDPGTGDTRFAVTAQEHQQNVLLFQQWLRDHPNG